MAPCMRRDNILMEAVGDEVVVYDEERHRAHRLSRTAALIWQACDGRRSIADLAALLGQELGEPVSEELVWLTLDRLETAHLLAEPLRRSADDRRLTRRRALAGALTALLPVVVTLSVLTPAQAQSPPVVAAMPLDGHSDAGQA